MLHLGNRQMIDEYQNCSMVKPISDINSEYSENYYIKINKNNINNILYSKDESASFENC